MRQISTTSRVLFLVMGLLQLFAQSAIVRKVSLPMPFAGKMDSLKKRLMANDHNMDVYEKNLKKVQHKLFLGNCKAVLTGLCGFSILAQICEEILADIPAIAKNPFFSKLSTNMKLSFGVLLLTTSHFLHNILELYDTYDTHQEIEEEKDKYEFALQYLHKVYANEKEAAKAFDLVAKKLYGPKAVTNFHEGDNALKRKKKSGFRGVIWCPSSNNWRLDSAIIATHD
jgi:hypothetical protein